MSSVYRIPFGDSKGQTQLPFRLQTLVVLSSSSGSCLWCSECSGSCPVAAEEEAGRNARWDDPKPKRSPGALARPPHSVVGSSLILPGDGRMSNTGSAPWPCPGP